MQQPKSKINLKKNQIVFSLNAKNYPKEVIFSTAYVFLDRAYIYLDGDPEKEIEVFLKGKESLSKSQLESLRGEFLNELLNYLLRVEVAQGNQKIREYIVASALVASLPSDLLDQSTQTEAESSDWKEDPLGIAVPWEEKNKKKSTKKKKKKK
ncbi:MAG: His-Xaa-Ser system protein HxsD [Candidatus Moranbacteria bacterium]|nr:His-Xaa-Ser system protein HxsD [Candidatus Moranbacteria bacterium]